MGKPLFNEQACCDVLALVLANELERLSAIMPEASKTEVTLYKALGEIVRSRVPKEMHDIMERERVYERAHWILLEAGFSATKLLAGIDGLL